MAKFLNKYVVSLLDDGFKIPRKVAFENHTTVWFGKCRTCNKASKNTVRLATNEEKNKWKEYIK